MPYPSTWNSKGGVWLMTLCLYVNLTLSFFLNNIIKSKHFFSWEKIKELNTLDEKNAKNETKEQ